MSPDDRTAFLEKLPDQILKDTLNLLTDEERKVASSLLVPIAGHIGGTEELREALRQLFASDRLFVAHDWKLLQTVTEKSPLTRTLKELEAGGKPGLLDIPLYDEEGLRLAERWQLRSVPAFVVVRGGRAHHAAGACSDLEALWECSK